MDGVYYSSIKLSNQGKPRATVEAIAEEEEIKKKRVRDAVTRLAVSRDRSTKGEAELPAQAKRPIKLLPGEN
jgi:hypothetical protein